MRFPGTDVTIEHQVTTTVEEVQAGELVTAEPVR